MRIAVVGTGYLGATHAAAMASLRFDVIGIDVDADKVSALNEGRLPFFEPGLTELVASQREAGRLRFTVNMAEVAACDVVFICVGTPQSASGIAADVTQVDRAIESVAAVACRRALIVGKSTVPAGTASRIKQHLRCLRPDLELAWNPEFLREGRAIEDTLRPDRLVVGVSSAEAEHRLKFVYAALLEQGVPWISTDLTTAELVKVAANSFLATKISFINAMAEICDVTGGDVTTLAEALGHDPRIGSCFLQAGIGFGGGCLPKDIRAFIARADELGAGQSLEFLRQIDRINLRARSRLVGLVHREFPDGLGTARVTVLGASFKPGSDDIRDSPALDIAQQLAAAGAKVTVHDPKAIDSARKTFPMLEYASSIDDAARGADAVLHLTEWPEYRKIDPRRLGNMVRHRVLIDGRNTLEPRAWCRAGWRLLALGRPTKWAMPAFREPIPKSFASSPLASTETFGEILCNT
jgi:UDPglucose 6-dehydrogenase